jgi:hypothetical protein
MSGARLLLADRQLKLQRNKRGPLQVNDAASSNLRTQT